MICLPDRVEVINLGRLLRNKSRSHDRLGTHLAGNGSVNHCPGVNNSPLPGRYCCEQTRVNQGGTTRRRRGRRRRRRGGCGRGNGSQQQRSGDDKGCIKCAVCETTCWSSKQYSNKQRKTVKGTHKVQARDAPICCSVAAPRTSRASSPLMAVATPVALMLARSWVKETTPSLS